MDDLVFEILWKIEEVKRIKRQRCLRRIDSFRRGTNQSRSAPNEGKIIDRNRCCRRNHFERKLTSSEIKNYIIRKTEAIQNQFKELNITLIDDEKDVERYTSKKSKLHCQKNQRCKKPTIVGRKEIH
jgi:hypothetical protein